MVEGEALPRRASHRASTGHFQSDLRKAGQMPSVSIGGFSLANSIPRILHGTHLFRGQEERGISILRGIPPRKAGVPGKLIGRAQRSRGRCRRWGAVVRAGGSSRRGVSPPPEFVLHPGNRSRAPGPERRSVKEQGMGQRTRWLDGDALIDCQYGRVSVMTWLLHEAERINKATGRVAEIRRSLPDGSNKVALFAS
jgi:hypothetical protein